MPLTSLIIILLVGGLAGFAASRVMRGHGLGTFGNVLVGILGALLGGFVFNGVGFGTLVPAVIGAAILLGLVSLAPHGHAAP